MRPWWTFAWATWWIVLALEGAESDIGLVWHGKHQAHPTRIVARYREAAALRSGRPVLESLGLRVIRHSGTVPGLVVLDGNDDDRSGRVALMRGEGQRGQILCDRIERLAGSGAFLYVSPSYVKRSCREPSDARYSDGTLWALKNTGQGGGERRVDIRAAQAWDVTTGSSNVIVAVVDSGVRSSHNELRGRMWNNGGEVPGNGLDDDGNGYVDDVFGIDAFRGSGDPNDASGHGTHVAGIIGAAADDGHEHVGIAWDVRLMACRFLGPEGFGFTDGAIECIDYAVRHGARVLNCSWAGGPFEPALLESIAAARRAGVLFVTAAGNEGMEIDADPVFPAGYDLDNIVVVGAMDRYGHLAGFSNRGLVNVDLVAPGVEIFSCGRAGDGAYAFLQGTSMAAGHVSGVAALVWSAHPGATLPELRERLLGTVTKAPAFEGETATGGWLNAQAAVALEPDGDLSVAVSPSAGRPMAPGARIEMQVTVTDATAVTDGRVRAVPTGGAAAVDFRNDGVAPDAVAGDAHYSAYVDMPSMAGPGRWTIHVEAPGKRDVRLNLEYDILDGPPNDAFDFAQVVPSEGGSLTGTNLMATLEPGEPVHAAIPSRAASLWWKWIPERSGRVLVDSTGSDFDTVVAVYAGGALRALRPVASADDSPGSQGDGRLQKQAWVTFDAVQGTTYQIAVAGYSAEDRGRVRLRVEPDGLPDSSPPIVVVNEPTSGMVLTDPGLNRVQIAGTALDPRPNASGIREVLVQKNEEGPRAADGLENWSIVATLEPGRNLFRVVVVDHAGNTTSPRPLTVYYRPPRSPNDNFGRAIPLVGTRGVASGDSSEATAEPGEPSHGLGPPAASVWWSFRAPADGALRLRTTGSSFAAGIAVYTGTAVARLTRAARNPGWEEGGMDGGTWAVRGGTAYSIAVDGLSGGRGTFQIEYALQAALVADLTLSASAGGIVRPESGTYLGGERIRVEAIPEPDYEFLHWEGDARSAMNPMEVMVMGPFGAWAVFGKRVFTEDFETGNLAGLPWESGSARPWYVQGETVAGGRFAARSSAIPGGGTASLILRRFGRAGSARFSLRVSSERTWDALTFLLNRVPLGRWSGEVPWTNVTFTVPDGTNVFEWRYSKDGSATTAGLDAAFVDNIELPGRESLPANPPVRIQLFPAADGMVRVRVEDSIGRGHVVEVSPDLSRWRPVRTNAAILGTVEFLEALSLNPRTTFYRAVIP